MARGLALLLVQSYTLLLLRAEKRKTDQQAAPPASKWKLEYTWAGTFDVATDGLVISGAADGAMATGGGLCGHSSSGIELHVGISTTGTIECSTLTEDGAMSGQAPITRELITVGAMEVGNWEIEQYMTIPGTPAAIAWLLEKPAQENRLELKKLQLHFGHAVFCPSSLPALLGEAFGIVAIQFLVQLGKNMFKNMQNNQTMGAAIRNGSSFTSLVNNFKTSASSSATGRVMMENLAASAMSAAASLVGLKYKDGCKVIVTFATTEEKPNLLTTFKTAGGNLGTVESGEWFDALEPKISLKQTTSVSYTSPPFAVPGEVSISGFMGTSEKMDLQGSVLVELMEKLLNKVAPEDNSAQTPAVTSGESLKDEVGNLDENGKKHLLLLCMHNDQTVDALGTAKCTDRGAFCVSWEATKDPVKTVQGKNKNYCCNTAAKDKLAAINDDAQGKMLVQMLVQCAEMLDKVDLSWR